MEGDETVGTETVETTETPVQEVSSSDLEAKVEKGLAALRASEDGQETPVEETEVEETPTEEVAETSTEEVSETEETPTDETPEGEDGKPEQQPKPVAGKKAPTLPDAYRRTLLAMEWTNEEIDAANAANPSQFTLTAQKLHAGRNAELARWADIGRKQRQEQEAAAAKAPKEEVSPYIDAETGTFRALDVDGLIEKFGNEELVRAVAGPVDTIIKQINQILPDLLTGVGAIQQSRAETMQRQVDGFFGSEPLKTFGDLYGTDAGKMSEEQKAARNGVLEMADALIAGAAKQGRTLTATDALLAAHDSLSGSHKDAAARKAIKTAVTKRGKGLTVKPTSKGGGSTNGAGPKTNWTQNDSAVRSRLANVFGGR